MIVNTCFPTSDFVAHGNTLTQLSYRCAAAGQAGQVLPVMQYLLKRKSGISVPTESCGSLGG